MKKILILIIFYIVLFFAADARFREVEAIRCAIWDWEVCSE